MKNLYMVQQNSQYGDSIYFPYAAGSLIAYAFQDEIIRSEYAFRSFFYKKDAVSSVIDRIENPGLVGFSCYVWNYEYSKTLAREIKRRYPDCIIVFGGHQLNDTSDAVGADYIDYILLGEGEQSFCQLLRYLAGHGELADIPNLLYKENGAVCRTPVRLVQIPDRVSPYVAGLFDPLFETEPLSFSAILETNRGCPNRCAFCDWGNIKARVHNYSLDLILQEIEWMAAHKIEYVYCADANFGLFPRDEEIVEYMIACHERTGYPKKFQATYSKNNPQTVFRITKRLNEAGMSKGATLSFQSMNQDVLNNIFRKNMPLEKFRELMRLYRDSGIATYSEIILGMPGESYETLCEGIEELLEYGQHMAINFFNCEMLPNSTMHDPEYIRRYAIETVRTEQFQYHVHPSKQGIREYSDIIVSTSSMTRGMWVQCNVMANVVRAFHNLGLLQCFAIYLFYEKHIRYMDFYEALIRFAADNPGSVCGQTLRWLRETYENVLTGNGSMTCVLPEYGGLVWPMDEGVFLKAVKEYDRLYEELFSFLQSFFAQDDPILPQLFAYQKAIVKQPCPRRMALHMDFDFYAYFSAIYRNEYHPLHPKQHTLIIDQTDMPDDLTLYAQQVIWFGRKGSQNIATAVFYK